MSAMKDAFMAYEEARAFDDVELRDTLQGALAVGDEASAYGLRVALAERSQVAA